MVLDTLKKTRPRWLDSLRDFRLKVDRDLSRRTKKLQNPMPRPHTGPLPCEGPVLSNLCFGKRETDHVIFFHLWHCKSAPVGDRTQTARVSTGVFDQSV